MSWRSSRIAAPSVSPRCPTTTTADHGSAAAAEAYCASRLPARDGSPARAGWNYGALQGALADDRGGAATAARCAARASADA